MGEGFVSDVSTRVKHIKRLLSDGKTFEAAERLRELGMHMQSVLRVSGQTTREIGQILAVVSEEMKRLIIQRDRASDSAALRSIDL